jgi:fused signal recognition particle receptor
MLGWFKKKFKKKVAAVPQEVDVEDVSTTPPPPEPELPEKELEKAPEASPSIDVTQKEIEPESDSDRSPPGEVSKLTIEEQPLAIEEPEPEPESAPEPEPVAASEPEPGKMVLAEPSSPEQEIAEPQEKVSEPEKLPEEKKKKTLFSRLSEKLGKTKETFTYQIDALFLGKREIDTRLLDDLEEILITADLGVGTTQELLEDARRRVKRKELADPNSLKLALKKKIKKFITDNEADATLVMPDEGPFVIMVIGVNGVGKTTTIGKIANKFKTAGSSVMLVAGDTFRAAAVAQLKIWGERNDVPVVSHKEGADPSSVVFDAIGIAISQQIDVVLVDTAGRMHTKEHLMEELKKIKRVMGKKLKGAPHEVMLVIDATTGQNGISQARLFDAAVDITGLTLTKLDGTSKGGIVANICKDLKIPIRFIGIGEQMDDLRDFDAGEFVDALFHVSDSKQ